MLPFHLKKIQLASKEHDDLLKFFFNFSPHIVDKPLILNPCKDIETVSSSNFSSTFCSGKKKFCCHDNRKAQHTKMLFWNLTSSSLVYMTFFFRNYRLFQYSLLIWPWCLIVLHIPCLLYAIHKKAIQDYCDSSFYNSMIF